MLSSHADSTNVGLKMSNEALAGRELRRPFATVQWNRFCCICLGCSCLFSAWGLSSVVRLPLPCIAAMYRRCAAISTQDLLCIAMVFVISVEPESCWIRVQIEHVDLLSLSQPRLSWDYIGFLCPMVQWYTVQSCWGKHKWCLWSLNGIARFLYLIQCLHTKSGSNFSAKGLWPFDYGDFIVTGACILTWYEINDV